MARIPHNLLLPTSQQKTVALLGMALYLHSASHISIYRCEAEGCQLLALSQYLITVQLCREKETFHLQITCLSYEKVLITFMDARLHFSEKLSN